MAADDLYPRIEARVERMYREGLLEEARALLEAGSGPLLTASQAIGYLEAIRHLRDGLPLEDARLETVRRTKALARRQMAWFRRDPRIRWFDVGPHGAVERTDAIEAHLLGG
jgi:tRNA dimethylallyltransferase